MDTYSMLKGHAVFGVVTGKPIELGGARGRNEATGRGVMVTVNNILKKLNIPQEEQELSFRVWEMLEALRQNCCMQKA